MDSELLFEVPFRFPGLPERGFDAFSIRDRDARRGAIIHAFHPPLRLLAEDLIERLGPHARAPLHSHLPRLDWPAGYQPFCTWLALSHQSHGYQSGPQLNVGVHADHVAARLAWDAATPGFGRFEFLCRHGGLGPVLLEVAGRERLKFRVYASARWPEGSRLVFESDTEIEAAFREVDRRGVWFEVGQRFELSDPADRAVITSAELGKRSTAIFRALLPALERLAT